MATATIKRTKYGLLADQDDEQQRQGQSGLLGGTDVNQPTGVQRFQAPQLGSWERAEPIVRQSAGLAPSTGPAPPQIAAGPYQFGMQNLPGQPAAMPGQPAAAPLQPALQAPTPDGVTPGSTVPGAVPPAPLPINDPRFSWLTRPDWWTAWQQWYNQYTRDRGQKPSDEEAIEQLRQLGNTTYDAAKRAFDRGKAYYRLYGRSVDAAEFGWWLRGQGNTAQHNWYQQMQDWYAKFQAEEKRQPSVDEWVNYFRMLTGTDDASARKMYQQGAEYFTKNGQRADEASQQKWLNQNDWNTAMTNWWYEFIERKGRKPNREEYVYMMRNLTGASESVAGTMYDRGIQYTELFGGHANYQSQRDWLGGAGTGLQTDWYNEMNRWWQAEKQQGRTPTYDQWRQRFKVLSGMNDAMAKDIWDRAMEYNSMTGQWASEGQQLAWMQQVRKPEYQYGKSLPVINKIVARNYLRLTPDEQERMLAAYEAIGYSRSDVLNSIQQSLPRFQAPVAGMVR